MKVMQTLMSRTLELTSEQLAVVAHNQGPALVFAVAGAGKTTAMVHRIERLVREGIYYPQRILATSFSRATVQELKNRLADWEHCKEVRPLTLHGIGWRVLKSSQKLGLFPAHFTLPTGEENSRQLYYQTLRAARSQRETFNDLENIDVDDFLDWVGACKSQFLYADLANTELPDKALEFAQQAKAPKGLPDYLTLFQLFEKVRIESGLITFDDLLVNCWETFHRWPAVLEKWRRLFDCLLVDEFQDINRVQSEILDLLSHEHNNYMAIGDDDQTIYQWRGASTEFIQGFSKRYGARKFLLTDNFRSTASQIVMANAVIHQNEKREPKRLHLTRGFNGNTSLHPCQDSAQQGLEVVKTIEAAMSQGTAPADIVILVRSYAQTPYIERQLIEKGISYDLPEGRQFFERIEIRDLLSYIALAGFDLAIAQNGALSDLEFESWNRNWKRLRNRPTRYLSNSVSQELVKIMRRDEVTLCQALRSFALICENYLGERLRELAGLLTWLGQAWSNQQQAQQVLMELERRLDWCKWLESSCAAPHLGRERADNVRAFLDFAKDFGSLAQMLDALQELSRKQTQTQVQGPTERIRLTSIHRAKGLEWQTVLIPGCNDGIYPIEQEDDLEAERRLLYVALTRAKKNTHLFYTRETPISPFLRTADYESLLLRIRRMEDLLKLPEQQWEWEQILQLFQLVPPLHLERFFQFWHVFPKSLLARIQGTLNFLQEHELWHKTRLDPVLRKIWCILPEAQDFSLTQVEIPEMEKVFCPQDSQLTPGQIRHARFGIGTIIKEAVGKNQDMYLIRFSGKGKMQLPQLDPELSR